MAETVTLFCVLTPKPGKFERLKEVLVNLCRNVQKNEKGCLRYGVWEQLGVNGEPDIILLERWGSQADLENHHTTPYLKETHKILEDEDILATPEVIKVVAPVEGWVSSQPKEAEL